MVGILTEKNSAMKNFAKALGGNRGTYNGEDYVIVSARGHLYEYIKDVSKQVPPSYASQYKSWDVANLPWDEKLFEWKRVEKVDSKDPKYKNAPKVKDILQGIKNTLSQCDEIVIATDVDPSGEGELLAWEILDGLNLRPKKWSRLYFMDEAPASIQKGFQNRKPIQSMHTDMDYVKALFRSQWDYLSMQWTRIASSQTNNTVIRQGRLKSAMVYIVGKQLEDIKNYKKIPFYQNRFRDENGVLYINKEEPMHKNKSDVPNNFKDSEVVVDSTIMKSTAPPKLLDLATLSSLLSSKGYKAKQVLAVYQKMYESQIVSYPRTEDKIITSEQFRELVPHINTIADVIGVDKSQLTHVEPRSTHVKNGGAHGANRPGLNVPKSLNDLDQYGPCARDIYILLAKSYLSMYCEDYQYEQQRGHVKDYPKFLGEVNVPKVMGFKNLMGDFDDEDDSTLSKTGLGKFAKPFIFEGFPKKPSQPTMKWLMTQLDKYNVGTGATRTSTYADISISNPKASPLLKDDKGKITMAECGEISYRLLPNTHIGSLELTENVVTQMKGIAKGELDPAVCLAEIQNLIRDDIITITENGKKMREELNIMENTQFEQKEKVTGLWSKTGNEVTFTRSWGGHRFTDDEVADLLAGNTVTIRGLVAKSGNKYGVIGELSEQTSTKGTKYVGFERLDFAPNVDIPDVWCQHKFTDEEKDKLMDGKVVHLDGCIGKKGVPFSCDITFGDRSDGKPGKGFNFVK